LWHDRAEILKQDSSHAYIKTNWILTAFRFYAILDPILQNLSYGMLFDTEELQEIVAVRQRLEAGFIADAIAAMDRDTLSQLWMLIDEMRQKTAAGEHFLGADLAFHRTIYLVTGNRLLIKLLDVFWTVYQNLHDRSLGITRDLEAELRNHEQILQAIEAKDVELARQRLLDHFDGIKERLKTAWLRACRSRNTGTT